MHKINIGIDIGNGNTKFRHCHFESKTEMTMLLSGFGNKKENVHEVKYNNLTYYIGQGQEFTTKDRHTSKPYLLCMLTAIALSSSETDIIASVCIGVPTMMFLNNKERVREIETHYNSPEMKYHKIEVNGEYKSITLQKVYVFAENASPLIDDDDDNQILIDIGEGTVNISQWENQVPLKIDTQEGSSSFLGLYIKIANYLKSITKADVNHKYVQRNLGNDTIYIDGKELDFSFSKEMMESHVRALASNIKTNFDLVSAKKIIICGGGATPTEKYWKSVLDNVTLVDDNQYINAKVYQAYVEMKTLQEN